MKRIIIVFLTLVLVLMPLTVSALPSETDSGIFYSIENGEVTVEGFNYAGTVLDIPDKIEGYPVKYIADQACRGNYGITELRLPASIVSIGEYSFAECENLTKVVMKGGQTVGYSAFRGCKALTSLTLPEGLTLIDDSAFEGCVMLGKVKMPKSLKTIGVDAFAGCGRLRFDANGNAVVKEYAEQYSIPTSFFDTWEFRLILIGICSAAVLAVLIPVMATMY